MSTYTYTPTLTPESNDSYIVKREFIVVECDPQPEVGSCDLFNNNLCGNDECYAQPFIAGDVLSFQWRFAMPLSMSLSFAVSLVDQDFNPIAYAVPLDTFGVGYDSEYQTYQWLNIDTALISLSVDYFHVKVVYGDDNKEWFSEPFERVKCAEETLFIQGIFNTGVDCYKNFHNNPPNFSQANNGYISQTRIWGTLEKIGHSISKEKSEEVEISTTVEQLFLLRSSRKVPQYVADKIAEAFSGTTIYIDGVQYEAGSSIEKDFEEGRMWIISSEIKQTCIQENFKCS